MTDNDDIQLLNHFRSPAGREKAFEAIMRRYQERIYWHIRRMVLIHEDTDDLVQNVFLKAWRGLDNFRGDSSLQTWLYTIATNETITFLKQKRKLSTTSSGDHNLSQLNSLQDDNFFSGDEAESILQRALLGLPEKQRLVFNMKYYGSLKYEEISEITGTSEGALKSSYHHAVEKIKNFLRLH